jgi:hypothetical protein
MNANTDHLKRIPYKLSKRGGPIQAMGLGQIALGKTGRFTASMQTRKNGKGTHKHKWIFGDENAVCTKCGYAIPKTMRLPISGHEAE